MLILPLAGKVGPASLSENTMGENLPVFTAFALEHNSTLSYCREALHKKDTHVVRRPGVNSEHRSSSQIFPRDEH